MSRDGARVRLVLALLLFLGLVTTVTHLPSRAAAAGVHPRLLFSASDIPSIRARAASGEGARAWATLKKRLDDYIDSPSQLKTHLDPSTIGVRDSSGESTYGNQNQLPAMLTDLAFGYVVTGDTTYSTLVIDSLKQLAATKWPFWRDYEQYLGAGDLLRGVALAFDWTYDQMSATDISAIVGGLNATLTFGTMSGKRILDVVSMPGAAAGSGSNWTGVTAGGAGLALLAISGESGAPTDLTTLLSQAESRVNGYLATGVGADGEGGEGLTYTNYGLHGALPFAFALKRAGGTDLVAAHPGLTRLVDYLASMVIPSDGYDGSVPLNDSERDALGDELIEQLWEINPSSSLQSWLWEHTLGPDGVDRYDPNRAPTYLPGHNCLAPQTNPTFYVLGCGWSNADELNLIYSRHGSTAAADPASTISTSLHFNDHGLVVGRTGWSAGAGDVVSTFHASRGPAGHTQQDVGQFTLYGYGADFAIDSGYGHAYGCHSTPHGDQLPAALRQLPDHPNCGPDDTTLAGDAGGHNVVLVANDGRTQAGARTNTSLQTIPEYLATGGAAYAHADTRTQFPTNPVLAGRDWAFVHVPGLPVLLLVADQLNKDNLPHGYNWQLHTSALNAVTPRANGFTVVSPSGAVLQGLTARNGDLAQSVGAAFAARPTVGSTFARPLLQTLLLQLDANGRTNTRLDELAVMALTPAGAAPGVVQRLEVTGANAIEVTAPLTGVGTTVVQRLSTSSGAVSGPGATLNGALGYAVDGMGESLLRQGSQLTAYGRDYVVVTGGSASVLTSAGRVQATGTSGASYKVYAPGAVTTVTVNGAAAAWTRSGDYITF